MNWPSFADASVFTAAVLFCAGIATAVIEGFFHKPKVAAETHEKRAAADKERALADQVKDDAYVKLIQAQIISYEKQLESNARLEKSNEQLQKYGARLQKEMQREMNELRQEMKDTKDATKALVDIVDRFMPLFRKVLKNEEDIQEFDATLRWARAVNGST